MRKDFDNDIELDTLKMNFISLIRQAMTHKVYLTSNRCR